MQRPIMALGILLIEISRLSIIIYQPSIDKILPSRLKDLDLCGLNAAITTQGFFTTQSAFVIITILFPILLTLMEIALLIGMVLSKFFVISSLTCGLNTPNRLSQISFMLSRMTYPQSHPATVRGWSKKSLRMRLFQSLQSLPSGKSPGPNGFNA